MRKRVVTLFVGAIMLAGCGGGVEGTPLAAERWDPCSITPEAVAKTGLDPSYREVGWGTGLTVEDWGRCVFKPADENTPYFLSVTSSLEHTVDEARKDGSKLDGRDLEVGDHDAFQYRTEVGRTGRSCAIAVSLPSGVAVFSVNDMSEMQDSRLCDLVVQHTNDLESSLPEAE